MMMTTTTTKMMIASEEKESETIALSSVFAFESILCRAAAFRSRAKKRV